MRWIYLSPHLDDAVLSAGGLIHDQVRAGIPVEIWTVMSGYTTGIEEYSFLAAVNHAAWGFSSGEETVRARRAEDETAAGLLGARAVHFDFLDCIYRRGRDGNWLYDVALTEPYDYEVLGKKSMEALTSPPHEEDANLPARIAQAVSGGLTRVDVLVCQLAVGSHVDHVLVRRAAELLGRPIVYDIDIPYLFYKPEEFTPKSAGMREKVHAVTEAGLRSWQEAVLAYKSQISVLGKAFDSPEKVRASLRSYWEKDEGIRLLELV
jgi:LmbE family N-acetylglucosaminyl deacetylase